MAIITAERYTPKALVSFSTEQGEIVLRAGVPETQGYAIDNDVLSISTNNDLGSDAGTFQIQLASRGNWDKVLASNDFVRIQMFRDRNEELQGKATVFMGLIDDVRKGVSLQGGKPQRSITVTGRTFAKALINFEVGVISEVRVTPVSIGWLMNKITFAGQSASQISQQIFDALVFEYMNYEFKNGQTFKTLTELNLSSRPGEILRYDNSFTNYQGSIQSFLREISNEPFNQMFWECYDGKAVFTLRETPFNPDNWNALPKHEITDKDVVTDSIGRSDIETFTVFSVGVQNFFNGDDVNATTGVFPYWYKPYFDKYGLRRLHRFTGYVGYANSADSTHTATELEKYQKDLFNWNIHNPNFYNGTITVKGDNKYKIGDRLLYKSQEDGRDIEFFIESVNHEFVNYQYWVTKLGVTRGVEEDGKARFSEPWGAFESYSGGAFGEEAISYAFSASFSNSFNMSAMPTANNYTGPDNGAHGQINLRGRLSGTDVWNDLLFEVGKREGVNPVFLKVIMAIESSGNLTAYNPTSRATGPFQILPRWYPEFDYDRMTKDMEYAIWAGAQVVKEKARISGKTDIYTVARYYYDANKGDSYGKQAVEMYTGLGFSSSDSVLGMPQGLQEVFPPATGASPTAQQIIAYAKTFIGKTRYVFGGGRTQSDILKGVFDCSSWVHYVFKQHGINLGSANPVNVNTDVIAKQGQSVGSVVSLRPGDLVFFNTYKYNGHVGIYMGDGKWIGCQTSNGVEIEDLKWWMNRYGLGSLRRVL